DLDTGHQGKARRCEVAVVGLVGVGVVDPRTGDLDEQLAGRGHRIRQLPELENLRAAESGDLDGTHARSVLCPATGHRPDPAGFGYWRDAQSGMPRVSPAAAAAGADDGHRGGW